MALFTPSFFRHLRNENRNENSGDLWFQEETGGRDKLALGLGDTTFAPRPSDDASKGKASASGWATTTSRNRIRRAGHNQRKAAVIARSSLRANARAAAA
jgi:hypothetical protein